MKITYPSDDVRSRFSNRFRIRLSDVFSNRFWRRFEEQEGATR